MSDYDPLAALAAQTSTQPGASSSGYDPVGALAAQTSAPTQAYDPVGALAAGKPLPASSDSSGGQSSMQPMHLNPINDFVQGAFDQGLTSVGGAVAGGLKGLWDLARGGGANEAAPDVGSLEQRAAYQPQTTAERWGANAASSDWNPLNWPGIAISKTGQFLGDTAERLGAPPWLSTALDVAPAAAVSAAGLKAAGIGPGEGYVPEVERVTPEGAPNTQSISAASVGRGALPKGAPEPDGAPVEGGYSPEAQNERAAILQRIGLGQARQSAIEGNAKDAASDALMSKYDQPAGRAAAGQFEAERNALTAHAENIIGETGGTIGMDEDALAQRGQTIARPFDQLREYFDANTRRLYAQADQRAAGTPLTNLDSVDTLLQNPSFRNTLLARDQGNLLTAVGNQLERFREGNPNGFTAAGAEQVRQWLNQVWTPDNKWAVGNLKDAIDNDVLKTAGEDVYQAARAQRQLRTQTLENPKGVATLFDTDPNTLINRTTPFERIPDKLAQLPLDQYTNVLQTLKEMPDELQPDAQAALGEIRGHLVNKLLQAGTQTAGGSARGLWAADRVANVLRTNAAKFRTTFQDDPQGQAGIKDLNSAGQILKADASYPGADAQAANAMKRGLISRTLKHVGGAVGAGTGGLVGPVGAAAGGVLGEMGGEALGASRAESAALKAWQKRVRALPQGDGSGPANK
ncbi:MAG: hypothetical protein WBE91_11745 [Steroidobacteraceae bacterium]